MTRKNETLDFDESNISVTNLNLLDKKPEEWLCAFCLSNLNNFFEYCKKCGCDEKTTCDTVNSVLRKNLG
jgi:predicted amidophosphoribosyltransferase